MTIRNRHSLAAFTLIELMVAVSLLTVIILSIGVVFKSTGNAVGLGEATGDMFSKVRVINQQLVSDVHGMDRNGFLIIRCEAEETGANGDADAQDQTDRFRRYDQISFISTGKFPNRTGSYQAANIFSDNTVSSSARIWYGQLLIEKDRAGADETVTPSTSSRPVLAGGNTSGLIPNSLVGPRFATNVDYAASPLDPAYESGFTLGRQALLLLNPPSGSSFPAGYRSIDVNASLYTATTPVTNGPASNEPQRPVISASRIGVAYTTVPQIMATVATLNTFPMSTGTMSLYCYRLKTLPSPTATNILDVTNNPSLPNGILRMHPIFAQGVPSFAVDWTDGTVDTNGNIQWFGCNSGSAGSYSIKAASTANTARTHSSATYGGVSFEFSNATDVYSVGFSPAKPTFWPKALRFTYRITDSNDRLNGGRTFVCVVDLPPASH
jgi:hypothetical protein